MIYLGFHFEILWPNAVLHINVSVSWYNTDQLKELYRLYIIQ
jgi:hypothetical protein